MCIRDRSSAARLPIVSRNEVPLFLQSYFSYCLTQYRLSTCKTPFALSSAARLPIVRRNEAPVFLQSYFPYCLTPVSYTHLDVYKRQVHKISGDPLVTVRLYNPLMSGFAKAC